MRTGKISFVGTNKQFKLWLTGIKMRLIMEAVCDYYNTKENPAE